MGSMRMLGENNWNNVSTTWDGVLFRNAQYDLFGAALATNGKESRDARLLGINGISKFGDSLVFFQHDNQKGTRFDIFNIDQYYTHQFAGMQFAAEGMAQLGEQGVKNVQAFAGMARLTRRLNDKLSVLVEGDIASGGGNANRTNQFTNYYGDHHYWDGISDMQGLSNVKELSAGITYAWSHKVNSSLRWYDFSLYDPTGGWFNKNETLNKSGSTSLVDATGKKGSDVGQEIDFETSWAMRKDTTLTAGLADNIPGAYLKAFTGTSFSKNSYWFFAQLNYKFGG